MKYIGTHSYSDTSYYQDGDKFYREQKESVDTSTTLKEHLKHVQRVLANYPDALFTTERLKYEDGYEVVFTYNVEVPAFDKNLNEVLQMNAKREVQQKVNDAKLLEELKKRSPELFK
jgi:hypothetical protein